MTLVVTVTLVVTMTLVMAMPLVMAMAAEVPYEPTTCHHPLLLPPAHGTTANYGTTIVRSIWWWPWRGLGEG